MEDDMDSNMDGMDGRKKNEKFQPSTFKNHQSFIHKVLTTVQQNTRVRQNKVESCCSTPANNGYPIITEAYWLNVIHKIWTSITESGRNLDINRGIWTSITESWQNLRNLDVNHGIWTESGHQLRNLNVNDRILTKKIAKSGPQSRNLDIKHRNLDVNHGIWTSIAESGRQLRNLDVNHGIWMSITESGRQSRIWKTESGKWKMHIRQVVSPPSTSDNFTCWTHRPQ